MLRTFSGLRVGSPGKRSATGGDGGASGRKRQKQKARSSDGAFLFTLLWQRLSPEAVLRTFSGLRVA
ncbi:hypothetical protein [Klebsiella aerogenes]|uniref:hypothetical protein n=1 Tax=Klebsiella TaxID=570 RepID=UPI001554B655|nr:hypothetical protein [Klebsiella aerogenes]EKM7515103.1 hypothetical protein [Klebsiella aerogenes]ELW9552926.1 hypothetical protein [Klebsiella aerogenes]MBS6146383.1 hypothetical protein [Klebsiella aerogenes]MCB4372638.1 hypothetical protein [Klebsiella aerogenes]HDT6627089.1 hypothetical protein [Klebsiella aerogenes]